MTTQFAKVNIRQNLSSEIVVNTEQNAELWKYRRLYHSNSIQGKIKMCICIATKKIKAAIQLIVSYAVWVRDVGTDWTSKFMARISKFWLKLQVRQKIWILPIILGNKDVRLSLKVWPMALFIKLATTTKSLHVDCISIGIQKGCCQSYAGKSAL